MTKIYMKAENLIVTMSIFYFCLSHNNFCDKGAKVSLQNLRISIIKSIFLKSFRAFKSLKMTKTINK